MSPPTEETVSEPVVQDVRSMDPISDETEYTEEEYQHFVDLYSRTLKNIDEHQIVSGRVLAITSNDVVIDIGFKSEGTVPLEEFGDPPNVNAGDNIEVFLESLEDSDGQLVLSKRKADFMRLWDRVVDIHNDGGTIDGTCTRRIKGGMVVDLMGVDAFLPGSQIDVKPIRDFDALIGQNFTFKIVKVNKLRKNIVVSRRALLEESMAEMRGQILEDLEKNQIREGTVKNITDFGVFVDLGGVDGLLHINDLSWGRVNHPSEVVKLDAQIKVMVLDFNDAKDRISLGMKQLTPHPWEKIDEKYPEGSLVKGKVVSIADYGAFVELERGVEGLVHVSELSWTRNIVHPSKVLNVGDQIDVKILNVDRERKRISLGVKQLTPDPWEEIEERFPVDSKFTGRVRNMTNFGAFIEMDQGIDGLIHISDLSWTRKVKHPSEILKKAEEIEVIVLDVNKKERRLSLGYKQMQTDPWPAFEEAYKVGTKSNAKITRFIEKGLIVELPLGLEGFVPLSQLDESTMAQVEQNMKEGDEVEFAIIEFDKDNKRIVLSRKQASEGTPQKGKSKEKTDMKAYMAENDSAPTLGEMADLSALAEEKPAEKKATKKKAVDKEESDEKSEDEAPKEKKPAAKKSTSKKKAEKEEPEAEADAEVKAEEPEAAPEAEEEKVEKPKKAKKAKKDEAEEKSDDA
ncbi:30S ribosomal protein S1 [candidate division KSB1 bacterium]|nr:30S ribosomal protein S1 [candidate division KSB1 bacterium]